MTKDELIQRIQEVLDMDQVVQMEHHGRPDCKNCSVAEVIQELINEEVKDGV